MWYRTEGHVKHPYDAQAWLELGLAYADARPGEGWAWAYISGLRHALRDVDLQKAVWGRATWRSEIGLPVRPLHARESLVISGLLLLTGALVGLSGLVASLGKPSHEWARARIAMSLLVLAGAGLTLLPWITAKESRAGVLIGGPVAVRPAPTAGAAAIATVPAGEAVRLLEEYGGWVRIQSDGGATGWVETPSVAQLAPVLRSSS
jgi:hypothetical protein